jgi:hypothetical protein
MIPPHAGCGWSPQSKAAKNVAKTRGFNCRRSRHRAHRSEGRLIICTIVQRIVQRDVTYEEVSISSASSHAAVWDSALPADWLGYAYAAGTLRSLLPILERHGIVTTAEVDVETFASRLHAEAGAVGGTARATPVVGAWGHKP